MEAGTSYAVIVDSCWGIGSWIQEANVSSRFACKTAPDSSCLIGRILRGKSTDAIVACCIFIACRQGNVPLRSKKFVNSLVYQRRSSDSVLKSSNMLLVSQLALPLLLLLVLRMHLATRMELAEAQVQAHLPKICSLVIVTTSTFIRAFRVSVVTSCFLRASTQSLKDEALSASLEVPFFSLRSCSDTRSLLRISVRSPV